MEYKISLRAARVNANMTQPEVAKRIGVSSRSICNWERGKSYPNGIVLLKLCELYGVPMDNILLLQKSD
jgi:DNA-binding XRE family transcriptional regulator